MSSITNTQTTTTASVEDQKIKPIPLADISLTQKEDEIKTFTPKEQKELDDLANAVSKEIANDVAPKVENETQEGKYTDKTTLKDFIEKEKAYGVPMRASELEKRITKGDNASPAYQNISPSNAELNDLEYAIKSEMLPPREKEIHDRRIERFGLDMTKKFEKLEKVSEKLDVNSVENLTQLNTADMSEDPVDGAKITGTSGWYGALLMNADSGGIDKAKAAKYFGKPVAHVLEKIAPKGTKLEVYTDNLSTYGQDGNQWANFVVQIRANALKGYIKTVPEEIGDRIIKKIMNEYPPAVAEKMLGLGRETQVNRAKQEDIKNMTKPGKGKILAPPKVKYNLDWQHVKNARIRIGITLKDLVNGVTHDDTQINKDQKGMSRSEKMFEHATVGLNYDIGIDDVKKPGLNVFNGTNFYMQVRSVPVNIVSNRMDGNVKGTNEFIFVVGVESGDINDPLKNSKNREQARLKKMDDIGYVLNKKDSTPAEKKKALAELDEILKNPQSMSVKEKSDLAKYKKTLENPVGERSVDNAMKGLGKFIKKGLFSKGALVREGAGEVVTKAILPGTTALGVNFQFKPDAARVMKNSDGDRIYIINVDGKNIALPKEYTPMIDAFTLQDHLPENHAPVKKPDMTLSEYFVEQGVDSMFGVDRTKADPNIGDEIGYVASSAAKGVISAVSASKASNLTASFEMDAYSAAHDVEYKKLLDQGLSYQDIQDGLKRDYSKEVYDLLPDAIKTESSVTNWNEFTTEIRGDYNAVETYYAEEEGQ